MPVTSAGILLYRPEPAGAVEVWIAHMGGPFWSRKDEAAWSIPKGEHGPDEDPLAVACREFEEEIGVPAPDLDYTLLGEYKQPSRKLITVYSAEYHGDLAFVASNTFEMEWPPRSGRIAVFPEIDRVEWFGMDEARTRLKAAQVPFLERLETALGQRVGEGS